MMGEGIMTHNNPFLGLYNQMFRRVKECESQSLQKKQKLEKVSKRLFQRKNIQSLCFFSGLRCFKATFAVV